MLMNHKGDNRLSDVGRGRGVSPSVFCLIITFLVLYVWA